MIGEDGPPPLPPRIDIPTLGSATIIEQFAGPFGLALFTCWTMPGYQYAAWRVSGDRRRSLWLLAHVPATRLLALSAGEIDIRDALAQTPTGQVVRLVVPTHWSEAIGELLPVEAVEEELPPPALRVSRGWMKGGHPWYGISRPTQGPPAPPPGAAPLDPPAPRAERKPPAPSRRRMRVWLAEVRRKG